MALPAAFIALTVWNVVGLVTEGAPESVRTDEGSASSASSSSARPADEITIAVSGDIGMESPSQAALSTIAASDPDLYLAIGDLSYQGPGSEQRWCEYTRATVGPVAPVQLVAGNHEEDTGEDGFIANYTACMPDRMGSTGEYGRQYYFDLGNLARIIMISPDLTMDGVHYFYGEDNPNQRWLEDAIDSARAGGIQWVIVAAHKTCISVAEYYCNMYQELFDVLIEKRVDLVLSGHDHSYQRSKQIAVRPGCDQVTIDTFDQDCVVDDGTDGQYVQGEGPVFVITGAGGAALYDVQEDDPEAPYFSAFMGANRTPSNGWSQLTVRESSLTLDFVTSSGSFDDRFEIRVPG